MKLPEGYPVIGANWEKKDCVGATAEDIAREKGRLTGQPRTYTASDDDQHRPMTTLTMISWKKGLQVVSLIEAVKLYSTGSLIRAKAEVERLLAGEAVTLEFTSESASDEFRVKAEACGAVFG